MAKSAKFRILETAIKIDSDDSEFLSYLHSTLSGYRDTEGEDTDISSSFAWQEELLKKNPLSLRRDSSSESIGANIILSRNENNIRFLKKIHGRRLKLEFTLKDGRLHQELFSHRKRLKELLDRLKNKTKCLHFFELSYFLLYYPLFWYLESFRDIHPLHASCVDTPGGSILMAGLPGSGKTVTSLSLWKKKGSALVSDNIVLYDGKKVYSCPEPIRLHGDGASLVGGGKLEELDVGASKGFYIVREGRAEDASPAVFLLMGLSDKFSVEEIDSESAAGMAFSQSIQGAEILNYFDYASLLNFLDIGTNLFNRRIGALKALFEGVKCFKVNVPRGSTADFISEKISGLL